MTTIQEIIASLPGTRSYSPYPDRQRPGDELRSIGFGMMAGAAKPGATGLGAFGEAGLGSMELEQKNADRALQATEAANRDDMARYSALSDLARAEEASRQSEADRRQKAEALIAQQIQDRLDMGLKEKSLAQSSALDRMRLNQTAQGMAADQAYRDRTLAQQAAEFAGQQKLGYAQISAADRRAALEAERQAIRDALPTDKQRDFTFLADKGGLAAEDALRGAFGLSSREAKPPEVQEFFDEATGQPYKAQFNPTTGQWSRVGGVKKEKAAEIIGADAKHIAELAKVVPDIIAADYPAIDKGDIAAADLRAIADTALKLTQADPSLSDDDAVRLAAKNLGFSQVNTGPFGVFEEFRRAAPSAVPAPAQRQVGAIYQTPKGPLRWEGNGWSVVGGE